MAEQPLPRRVPSWQVQVAQLRQAAEVITGCAEAGIAVHDAEGRELMALRRSVSRPIAATLLVAAEDIERHRSPLGLPVNNALEIAGLVQGVDLGHNR